MMPSVASFVTIVAYAIAAHAVVWASGAPPGGGESALAIAGVLPVALYCSYLDSRGR